MDNNTQGRDTAPGSYRRDVVKALGAGTALNVVAGGAAARSRAVETPEEHQQVDDAPMANTVHVVRTLITQSTNPERPADFFFQPTGLHVQPGDVVRFVFETPDHNVTAYHPAFGMQRRLPPGVQPFSSPLLGWDPNSLPDDINMPPAEEGQPAGEPTATTTQVDERTAETDGEMAEDLAPRPSSWLHSFETPGVYDMECAPHEAFGMAMRVVVGDETETAFETTDPNQLPPPRVGPVGLSRQVLTDENLDPEAIVEQGRVAWDDLAATQASTTGGDTETEGGD